MSVAAEQAVQAFSHPKVKGSVRALLEQIAKQIPEGQTMTAPIAMDALAAAGGYGTRTMWNACDALIEVRAIRLVDRRRGRTARYELLDLPGAGVADPTLPLRADLHALHAKTPAELGPLFQPPTIASQAPEVGRTPSDLFSYVWLFNLGSFFIRWLKGTRTYDLFSYLWSRTYEFSSYVRHPLDVDPRAREYVHTSKNTHTPAAAPLDVVRPPPCRLTGTVHAWCGRVCVPRGLHQEFQRKGHAAAWLTAFYARTCAAIPTAERITVDDYKFWRAALQAELVNPAAPGDPAAPDTCTHTDPPCANPMNWRCRQRTSLEEARQQQRKSG